MHTDFLSESLKKKTSLTRTRHRWKDNIRKGLPEVASEARNGSFQLRVWISGRVF